MVLRLLWSSCWHLVWPVLLPRLGERCDEVMLLLLLGSLLVEVCKESARLASDLCNQKVFC